MNLDDGFEDVPWPEDGGDDSDPPGDLPDGVVVRAASEIRREQAEWVDEDGLLLRGSLSVLAGVPGLGKSLLTCLFATVVSRGASGLEPGNVLMLSAEDSPEATVKPRLEAAGADLDRVFLLSMRRDGFESDLSFPADLAGLVDAVEEKRPDLVTIDPLMAHVGGSVDSHKDHSVRRMLAPLARVALGHRLALLLVLHLNKGGGAEVLQRLGGSVGFMGAARSVLVLGRDPEDPGGESGSRRVLAHAKSNVSELRPSRLYEIEPFIVPAGDEEPAVHTARLMALGESDYEANELLVPGASAEAEQSKLEQAKEFLREFLAAGPRSSQDVKQAADEAGISRKTLRRAREQLGIVTRHVDYPATTSGNCPKQRRTALICERGEGLLHEADAREARVSERMSAPGRALCRGRARPLQRLCQLLVTTSVPRRPGRDGAHPPYRSRQGHGRRSCPSTVYEGHARLQRHCSQVSLDGFIFGNMAAAGGEGERR